MPKRGRIALTKGTNLQKKKVTISKKNKRRKKNGGVKLRDPPKKEGWRQVDQQMLGGTPARGKVVVHWFATTGTFRKEKKRKKKAKNSTELDKKVGGRRPKVWN